MLTLRAGTPWSSLQRMIPSTEVRTAEHDLLSAPKKAAAHWHLLCAGTASTVETALRLFSQSFGKVLFACPSFSMPSVGAAHLLMECADPLVMGNGRNLIDMLCKGFESPDSSDDDEEQYDYSEQPAAPKCKPQSVHAVPSDSTLPCSECCCAQVASE